MEVRLVCLCAEKLLIAANSSSDSKTLVLYGIASGCDYNQLRYLSSISIVPVPNSYWIAGISASYSSSDPKELSGGLSTIIIRVFITYT